MALNREHGISLLDRSALAAALVQASFAGGMLATLRRILHRGSSGFLWIKDLSEPSLLLAGLAAGTLGLVGALGSIGGGSEHSLAPLVLVPVVTLLVVARMSSGFALHLLASSTVGVLQAIVVRRRHGNGSLRLPLN